MTTMSEPKAAPKPSQSLRSRQARAHAPSHETLLSSLGWNGTLRRPARPAIDVLALGLARLFDHTVHFAREPQ